MVSVFGKKQKARKIIASQLRRASCFDFCFIQGCRLSSTVANCFLRIEAYTIVVFGFFPFLFFRLTDLKNVSCIPKK